MVKEYDCMKDNVKKAITAARYSYVSSMAVTAPSGSADNTSGMWILTTVSSVSQSYIALIAVYPFD